MKGDTTVDIAFQYRRHLCKQQTVINKKRSTIETG